MHACVRAHVFGDSKLNGIFSPILIFDNFENAVMYYAKYCEYSALSPLIFISRSGWEIVADKKYESEYSRV